MNWDERRSSHHHRWGTQHLTEFSANKYWLLSPWKSICLRDRDLTSASWGCRVVIRNTVATGTHEQAREPDVVPHCTSFEVHEVQITHREMELLTIATKPSVSTPRFWRGTSLLEVNTCKVSVMWMNCGFLSTSRNHSSCVTPLICIYRKGTAQIDEPDKKYW